jgi:hypothetical protein
MHPGWYIFLIILLFLMIIFSGIMIFSTKPNMIISQVFINSRKNTNSLILIPLIIIFAICIILAVLAGVLIINKSKFLNIFFIFFNILLLGSVIFFSIEVSKPSFTFVNIDEYVIYGLIALGSVCVLFGIILTIEFMLSKKIEKNELHVEPLPLIKPNLSKSERKKCDYIIKRLNKENEIYINKPYNDFIIDNDNDTQETTNVKRFIKDLKWKINDYIPGCKVNLGVLNSLFHNKFKKNRIQTENFIDNIVKDYNKNKY